MNILVTGANGQLGSEFRSLSLSSSNQFVFCDVDEMDLSSELSIISYLNTLKIDIIINCGAYTNVDGAEDNLSLAQSINSEAPAILAEYCSKNNIRLIHISTDYIFDGKGNTPIVEDQQPNPLSVYGSTKLAGERAILGELDSAYVFRTSWVYSTHGHNFVKTMLRLAAERDSLNVVYDQIGTPTYAGDLAQVILNIIDKWDTVDHPGVYHYSNQGVLSWYDFATAIFDLSGFSCKVNPVRSTAFPTKAVRPTFSLLSKEKITQTFDIEIPYWKDSLVKCLDVLKHDLVKNS
ncbi:MAG: dTDP-4-dehydrorhamnose reductase [Bacteroidota bacterium]